ncbi:unnamed protein product, partial [Ectocarpus fasciculatus]
FPGTSEDFKGTENTNVPRSSFTHWAAEGGGAAHHGQIYPTNSETSMSASRSHSLDHLSMITHSPKTLRVHGLELSLFREVRPSHRLSTASVKPHPHRTLCLVENAAIRNAIHANVKPEQGPKNLRQTKY